MASLQHVTDGGRDAWRVRVYLNGHRKTIGLGAVSSTQAQEAAEHLDELIHCNARSKRPPKDTRRWLEEIGNELHARIATLGLAEPRAIRELPETILAYCRHYIKSREDWKKPENYRQAVDKLERFLGRDILFSSLTKGEAERFHRWMITDIKLSPNTAGQNIKRLRQLVKAAMDDHLTDENPFTAVKISLTSDKSKNRFITYETALALLDACPDQEWRTLFALCRFGGLRNPSETLALRWSDINWERGRFKIHASKTKRYGKGERVAPLFPELRTELDALFALVQPGLEVPADSYVIQSYRDTETNLRKALNRVADAAGVEQWPKPFMALRASRRTELEREGFKNHVLNEWFGHSGAVAETHYLSVTEDDFEAASGTTVIPSVVPSGRDQRSSPARRTQKNPGKTGALMAGGVSGGGQEYTRQDSNLQPSVPKTDALSNCATGACMLLK